MSVWHSCRWLCPSAMLRFMRSRAASLLAIENREWKSKQFHTPLPINKSMPAITSPSMSLCSELAMLNGLKMVPKGFTITSIIASFSRDPMLSLKHDPTSIILSLWRMKLSPSRGCIIVRNSISQNFKNANIYKPNKKHKFSFHISKTVAVSIICCNFAQKNY